MQSLFFRFTLAFLFLFTTALNVNAFESLALKNKTLNTQYINLQKYFETRYEKFAFTTDERAALKVLESAVSKAYLQADGTLKGKELIQARKNLRSAITTLKKQVIVLERSKNSTRSSSSINSVREAIDQVNGTSTPSTQTPPVTSPSTSETSNSSTPSTLSSSSLGELGDPVSITYYSDRFEGAKTANGDTFTQSGFSAARCSVAFNQLLQVQYADKSVIVKANDRPNCEKYPKVVDLSTEAFGSLAPLSKGRMDGNVRSLGSMKGTKTYLPRTYFSSFSIELDGTLPNTILPNETFIVSGRVTNGAEITLLYIITPSGKTKTLTAETDAQGNFTYYVNNLSEIGDYDLVVTSGLSFSSAKPLKFRVIDPNILSNKAYNILPISPTSRFSLERIEGRDFTPTNLFSIEGLPKNTLKSVHIRSKKGSTLDRSSMGKIAFSPEDFSTFQSGDVVSLSLGASMSSTPYSMDTYSSEQTVFSGDYTLSSAYAAESHEPISVTVNGSSLSLKITGKTSKRIRSEAYMITPSGGVDTIRFASSQNSSVLSNSEGASLSYTFSKEGTYLLEVMWEDGFPAYLTPFSYGKVLSILPNEYDRVEKDLGPLSGKEASEVIGTINSLRASQGLSALETDTNLMNLAQIKANDMAANNYTGHVDSQGTYIDGTAKRNNIAVPKSLGENVAGGNVSVAYLQAGLSLSGGHRLNMLEDWSKIGVGVAVRNGEVYIAQVFGK